MLDPKKSLFDEDGNPRPALTTTLDNVLRMQRPLALSIVKKLREAHPNETPAQIHKRLDRNYLRDITAIGGVTGASAFVPGIGTVTSMSLSYSMVSSSSGGIIDIPFSIDKMDFRCPQFN